MPVLQTPRLLFQGVLQKWGIGWCLISCASCVCESDHADSSLLSCSALLPFSCSVDCYTPTEEAKSEGAKWSYCAQWGEAHVAGTNGPCLCEDECAHVFNYVWLKTNYNSGHFTYYSNPPSFIKEPRGRWPGERNKESIDNVCALESHLLWWIFLLLPISLVNLQVRFSSRRVYFVAMATGADKFTTCSTVVPRTMQGRHFSFCIAWYITVAVLLNLQYRIFASSCYYTCIHPHIFTYVYVFFPWNRSEGLDLSYSCSMQLQWMGLSNKELYMTHGLYTVLYNLL